MSIWPWTQVFSFADFYDGSEGFEPAFRVKTYGSGLSCGTNGDFKMYQEHLASYLAKMLHLHHIRNVLQVTWRRCYIVAGTPGKLLEEEFTMYQERLANYLQKMLRFILNIWQVTWRRFYNVAGPSCMLLEEVVPKHQEHLASYLKKILHRIRNVLQVTSRRF